LKYLTTRKKDAILALTQLLNEFGFDNDLPEKKQCRMPITFIENNTDRFIKIIKELSN